MYPVAVLTGIAHVDRQRTLLAPLTQPLKLSEAGRRDGQGPAAMFTPLKALDIDAAGADHLFDQMGQTHHVAVGGRGAPLL